MTVTLLSPRESLDAALAKYAEPLARVPTGIGTLKAGSAEAAIDRIGDLKTFIAAEKTAYPRPNGVDYLPRRIKLDGVETQDVTFVKMAYAKRMPVLLFGAPGCGKTALLEAALPNLVTVMGSVETETADFLGSWTQQPDGTYKWVDGPLVVALENGWPMLIDEIALIDPRVMAVVYAVMDGRDRIDVTANPERGTVEAKDGFAVYGACNPNVPGAVMSDALLSRFQLHVEVTTDWSLCKRLGVPSDITQVARNLHAKLTGGAEILAAPQLRELLTYVSVVETYGVEVALRNFVSQARAEDRPTYQDVIKSVFGVKDAPTAMTF